MLRKILKRILVAILNFEACLIVKKYKPEIIGITGSVGKTSAKEAIWAVLSSKFSVLKSEKNHNTEFGVPLTIMGAKNPWFSPAGWAEVVFKGLGLILKGKKGGSGDYPQKIILEMGVDRPGDMEDLARFKLDVVLVTAIGEVPAHVEYFAGPEDVAREKAKLVEMLGVHGWAALNGDDYAVLEMKSKTKGQVLTFGFGADLDLRASEYKLMYREDGRPEGMTFKMDYAGSSVPVRIFGSFGKQNVYAALAGAGCGIVYGMNLVEISETLSKYKSLPGRLNLIEGEKGTWILDDTYNASPQATHAAIDLLKDLPRLPRQDGGAGRKIAVLGDMLEIGKFTIQSHQEVGDQLKKVADIVITCGPRAKFIAQELLDHGFATNKIVSVSDSYEAGKELEKIIQPNDLILVKGSQAMRMERAVEEIMAHPEKKSELLVRQEPEWLNKA